jgi:hypothetical protein
MAAMRTMPGTQASADDGRLLVRGGDVYESKTFIDGLLTAKPYNSKTPDIATRGRFSPSLFSGVQFSSGGYSAKFGQALSSVLELNSTEPASSDNFGFSLMSIGGEGSYTKAFKKGSATASAGYTNMGIYQSLMNSALNWTKPVESVNLSANVKYKPNTSGTLKAFVNYDYSELAYETLDEGITPFRVMNKNNNIYSNINYKDCLSENTCYKIGVASTYDKNEIELNNNSNTTIENSIESKITITHFFSEKVKFDVGLGDNYLDYNQQISQTDGTPIFDSQLSDHIASAFLETEIKFNKYLAIRPGLRSEYSTILSKWNIAPRFALAVKTGKNSQFSAAWGRYYQNPQSDYLKFNKSLNFENASHYIASYQWGVASKRLLRTELYHKKYNQLITWEGNNTYYPKNISNEGKGYASGIDIFWKDKKSIKHFEYWLTYSYIDTKRKYQNFKEMAKPNYVADHTFSLVTKYWANSISTQFGTSLTSASPRTFINPNSTEAIPIKTNTYSNLSVNMSHVFYLGDRYSVFYVSLSNVLGNTSTISYRLNSIADTNGNYALTPIKRDLNRFLFVGLFLSF